MLTRGPGKVCGWEKVGSPGTEGLEAGRGGDGSCCPGGGLACCHRLPTQGIEVSWGEAAILRVTKSLNSSDLNFCI